MSTDTVVCKVVDYTYVESANPSSPLKSAAKTLMHLKSGSAYPYLIHGLPKDFAARYCTSAILEIVLANVPTSVPIAQRLDQPVGKTLSGVTWNNKPGVIAGSSPVSGTLKAGTMSTYQFDVTTEMGLVQAGAAWWGFRISTADTTLRNVRGPQSTANPPTLTLVLSDDTPTPAAVGPAGVTALGKPVVSWQSPNDVDQIRLQVDAVGGAFTSPVADTGVLSGALGSTAQQIDTSTTTWTTATWAGLTNGGAAADIRVGQHGPRGWTWSAPITVNRVNYPALSTSLPASGGTTNDPTPQHAWTFTPQRQWRLFFKDANGNVWYDAGVRAGADQTWTPVLTADQTKLLPDLATMTSTLQVWDTTASRVASQGDKGYVETSWSWTVQADGATTAPTSVTASQVGRSPAVTLGWSRASGAPDEWLIVRDGLVVARFPGSTGQSGTNWTWLDWTATPNKAHTYAVAAIVANKASARAAATAFTPSATGVWVYSPDTGAYFSLAGDSVMDNLELAGASVIYTPVYGTVSLKRTMALRGYEGTVGGFIEVWDGRSIDTQLADLHTIRTLASATMRVILPDANFPALVSDLSAVLSGDALPNRMVRRVTMRVDQVGEFPDALSTVA